MAAKYQLITELYRSQEPADMAELSCRCLPELQMPL